MDSKLGKQKTCQEGTRNTDQNIANNPKTCSLHDLSCKPPRDKADKQNYEKALT